MHSWSAIFDINAPLGVHRDLATIHSSLEVPSPVTVEFTIGISKEANMEDLETPIDHGNWDHNEVYEDAPSEEANTPLEEANNLEELLEDVQIQVEDMGLFDAFEPSRIINGDFSTENIIEGSRRSQPPDLYINDTEAQANDTERRMVYDVNANLAMVEPLVAIDTLFSITAKVAQHSSHLRVAHAMAAISMKDMSWKRALKGADAALAIQAFQAEYDALAKRILTRLTPGSDKYKQALLEAVLGRVLLDRKRNGVYKARMVKQGFKEDKEALDGSDFTYYANVCEFTSVRTMVLRPNRGDRCLASVDISTAFLQSTPYGPHEPPRFLVVTNPITGEKMYFQQSGPIYGESSAPVRWENTIVPFLKSLGFERGENDRCAFYHPTWDLLILLYVDDILADGARDDIAHFFALLAKRFDCKEPEWLTPHTPIDFLGILIMMDSEKIYMSMEPYIEKMLEVLNISNINPVATPINAPIEDDTPISREEHKWVYQALGCCGWLANTVRVDGKYAHSRIAQHISKPTKGLLKATKHLLQYYKANKDYVLAQPLHSHCDPRWAFRSDSDHAGNAEPQNRRRSQNGCVAINGEAPIFWTSKPSSVTFPSEVCAHPKIGEAHADMSSGAVEIYAAGNATLDLLHISYVTSELNMEFPDTIDLGVDNTTAISFADRTCNRSKLKHIDCRQEWVKTLRDKGIVKLVYVPTDDNVADMFTKILAKDKFCKFRNSLMDRKSYHKSI